jgi:protein gp37
MGAKTAISWTDATWNPIRGCSMAKGSEAKGCLNCYAARFSARGLPGLLSPTTGEPFARILQSGPRWTGKVELIDSQLALPMKWRKPKRIFVNSMSDLFHEALTITDQERIFRVMLSASQHTYQILTKRPEMMALRVPIIMNRIFGMHWKMPDFIWLGVSVEDQKTANERIPLLLRTPAARRFVSYEPALGPVNFNEIVRRLTGDSSEVCSCLDGDDGFGLNARREKLDQIIIGGESGPKARPFDIQWARNTIRQCREGGVPVWVKQLGPNPYDSHAFEAFPGAEKEYALAHVMKNRAGADPSEWPEDLRVQEHPR